MFDNNNQPMPPPIFITQTSTLSIISLAAGILGWVGFIGIGPIVAIITGHIAKNEITKSNGHLTGKGMATAGLVLGYINLGFIVLGLCLVTVVFILGVGIPILNQN